MANVTFVERSNEAGYIDIIREDGCYSYVGRTGSRQPVSIGSGCGHTGIVAHEFLHALGFYHEQSRSDRDNYVNIHWENIRSGMESNFNKESSVTSSVGPYDVKSIMHYGYKAFSTNGQPTITSKDPAVPHTALGQRINLTDLDIAALQHVYGKPTGTSLPPPPITDTKLKNGQAVSVTGSKDKGVHFTIDIPSNSTLKVSTSGGSGDADLYVKRAMQPTSSSYDCRPYKDGNTESCELAASAATYHIMLKGYADFANVSLVASYQATTTPPPAENKTPVAAFTVSVTDLQVRFANQSTDSDGTISAYLWAFGDNSTSSDKTPTHAYAKAGSYQVTLTVTDNQGATKALTKSVLVNDATTPPTGNCVNPWQATSVYNNGDTASQNGNLYKANWWTKGDTPADNSGQWQIWTLVSAC